MYTNKYFFLKIVVNRNKAQNIASMFEIYLLNKLRSICSEYLINQSFSTQYVMHIIIFQYSWKLFIFFFIYLLIFFSFIFKNDLKCIKNTNTNFSTHKCYFLKEKKTSSFNYNCFCKHKSSKRWVATASIHNISFITASL